MANRIREIRKQKGMTLLQVAEKLGVSESTVQRYESGNIKNLKYETMVALANIFNCNPSYLMGWEDKEEVKVQTLGHKKEYYEDEELAKEAQEMFEDKQMRSLFHMKKNMDPKRFKAHVDMMEELYRLEHPEEFPEDSTD